MYLNQQYGVTLISYIGGLYYLKNGIDFKINIHSNFSPFFSTVPPLAYGDQKEDNKS